MELLNKKNITSAEKYKFKNKITSDHFIINKNKIFAGRHIILDLWQSNYKNSILELKKIIKNAVKISKATLIHIHLHRFGKEQGISGVAVLAESHLSVHTWPERNYIAFDMFMCGDTDPIAASNYLIATLKPKKKKVLIIKRGVTNFDR